MWSRKPSLGLGSSIFNIISVLSICIRSAIKLNDNLFNAQRTIMHFRIYVEFMCSNWHDGFEKSEEWVKSELKLKSSITLVSRFLRVDVDKKLKVFTHDVNNLLNTLGALAELTGREQ